MNFLAHSLLGFDDSELVAGQFCGDFVRGSQLSHFPAGIESGIRLHRHLDRFTDSHAALASQRENMSVVPRRFAGIVIDVLFDHHLARHWHHVSRYSLDHHAANVHDSLHELQSHLPESLKRFMALMRRENILQGNRHLESIELTLKRISRRSPRFSALALTQSQLEPLRDTLHEPFTAFYPELHAAAHRYLVQRGHEFDRHVFTGNQAGHSAVVEKQGE